MSQYHEVADKTMDHLLESLEELDEVERLEGYEVEFHVRDLYQSYIDYKRFSPLFCRVGCSHSIWVLTEPMS